MPFLERKDRLLLHCSLIDSLTEVEMVTMSVMEAVVVIVGGVGVVVLEVGLENQSNTGPIGEQLMVENRMQF